MTKETPLYKCFVRFDLVNNSAAVNSPRGLSTGGHYCLPNKLVHFKTLTRDLCESLCSVYLQNIYKTSQWDDFFADKLFTMDSVTAVKKCIKNNFCGHNVINIRCSGYNKRDVHFLYLGVQLTITFVVDHIL